MRVVLAIVSAALGIANTLCTIFDAEKSVRVWASIAAAAVLLIYFAIAALASGEQNFAWRVSRYCKKVKEGATRSIEISAGDCSWLAEETPIFLSAVKRGVSVKLLVEEVATTSVASKTALDTLLKGNPTAIAVRIIPKKGKKLRCIIVDRDAPDSRRLLFKKKSSDGATEDLPFKGLRRNQTMFVVPQDSHLYEWTAEIFDNEWKRAKVWDPKEPS